MPIQFSRGYQLTHSGLPFPICFTFQLFIFWSTLRCSIGRLVRYHSPEKEQGTSVFACNRQWRGQRGAATEKRNPENPSLAYRVCPRLPSTSLFLIIGIGSSH